MVEMLLRIDTPEELLQLLRRGVAALERLAHVPVAMGSPGLNGVPTHRTGPRAPAGSAPLADGAGSEEVVRKPGDRSLPGGRQVAGERQLQPVKARHARRNTPYTDDRLALLREGYPHRSNDDLFAELIRLDGPPIPSVAAMFKKAKLLGLRKSDAYMAALRAKTAGTMRAKRSAKPKPAQRPVVLPRAPASATHIAPQVAVMPAKTPARGAAPKLPPPAESGKVEVPFGLLRDWAAHHDIYFDGTNVDRINKYRASFGAPPVVVLG